MNYTFNNEKFQNIISKIKYIQEDNMSKLIQPKWLHENKNNFLIHDYMAYH